MLPSYQPKRVVLDANQTTSYDESIQIFMKSHCCFNLSEMGSGKTMLPLKYAQDYNSELLVICKAANEDHWREHLSLYGVRGYVTSYNKFRGTRLYAPKHGLIEMKFKISPKSKTHKETMYYEETQLLKDKIAQGMMIVLDEFQEVRNTSSNNKAVKTLCKTIRESPPSSTRIWGLSALPACRQEELCNILRAFGIIKKRNLHRVDPSTGTVILEGLQDLINSCNWYDPVETQKTMGEYLVINKSNSKELVVDLYMHVIKPRITSAMPELVIPGVQKLYKNGFFQLAQGSDTEGIRRSIAQISRAARFGEADSKDINFGAITLGLINFYKKMAPTNAHHARLILNSNPGAKYIYFCMNTEPLHVMKSLLAEFNPVIFDGKTSKADRRVIKADFNAPNNKCRVILANCSVGGVGTSFHDTSVGGKFPRYTHIMPHYSFLTMAQCSGRTYRFGSTSDSNGYYVFGSEGMILSQVLESLIKKAHLGREIVEIGDVKRSRLPSDWPSVLVKLDGSEVSIETPKKKKEEVKKA